MSDKQKASKRTHILMDPAAVQAVAIIGASLRAAGQRGDVSASLRYAAIQTAKALTAQFTPAQ